MQSRHGTSLSAVHYTYVVLRYERTARYLKEFISECEKLGDYVVNVVEARTDIKEKKI